MKQLIKKENVKDFFKVKLVNFLKEHGIISKQTNRGIV